MTQSIQSLVNQIQREHFVFPPVGDSALNEANRRGIPNDLIEFYSFCDGALIGEGSDFPDLNGQRYRLRIPSLSSLQSVQSYGYIDDSSPLYDASAQWWQFVDYGDANWLIYDATPNANGRVIDGFHETVGQINSHLIVASSLPDLLQRLIANRGVYWLGSEFKPLGIV